MALSVPNSQHCLLPLDDKSFTYHTVLYFFAFDLAAPSTPNTTSYSYPLTFVIIYNILTHTHATQIRSPMPLDFFALFFPSIILN